MLQARKLRAVDAAVQEHAVHRIHRVLALLQPVAGRVDRIRHEVVTGDVEGIENGEGRHVIRRAHIGEDQPLELLHRIGRLADLGADRTRFGFARRLEDRAVDIKMPAVIAAANAALLDAAVLERRAAMCAVPTEQADLAALVAEDHQVFAEDADGNGEVLELRGHRHRMPEAAEIFAAGCAGAYMRQLLVFLQWPCHRVALVRLGCPACLFRHRLLPSRRALPHAAGARASANHAPPVPCIKVNYYSVRIT